MAFPIGAAISALGQGSQSIENQNSNTGVGVRDDVFSKILGPLAPQFYINTAANRAEKERLDKRQGVFDTLNQSLGKEQLKSSIADRANASRSQNMTGFSLLAQQRQNAMNNFNDRTFKNAFFRS